MMRDAIFLSAGVPDPERAPGFARTADTVAITEAVSALLYVTLGRRPLVWGGHPAITPMVWAVAQSMGVAYGRWVSLYQSEFWKDEFPEDNARFGNVTYTQAVKDDREASLELMRRRIFSENGFSAAVFIGGMAGILDEHRILTELQPGATVVPVGSTGGAAATLPGVEADVRDELAYVSLFHRRLGIPIDERRRATPDETGAAGG